MKNTEIETQKEQYINRINRNLKRRRVCHIIALIVFLIQLALNLLTDLVYLQSDIISIDWDMIDSFDVFNWIVLLLMILLSIIVGIPINKYVIKTRFAPIPKNVMDTTLCELVGCNPYLVALVAFLWGYNGTYGLASIPLIIGHIFFIIVYVNMKKYNKLYTKHLKVLAEQLSKQKNATDLLKKCGKCFFIKYYYQLKKQNLIDVVDAIQENYSEDTKKSRIVNAKKIFYKNLQIEALNEILKNEDGAIGQTFIDSAKAILEKEKTEQANYIGVSSIAFFINRIVCSPKYDFISLRYKDFSRCLITDKGNNRFTFFRTVLFFGYNQISVINAFVYHTITFCP